MFLYVKNERCGEVEWERNDCVKASWEECDFPAFQGWERWYEMGVPLRELEFVWFLALDLGLIQRLTGWMAICLLAEKLPEPCVLYGRGSEKPSQQVITRKSWAGASVCRKGGTWAQEGLVRKEIREPALVEMFRASWDKRGPEN